MNRKIISGNTARDKVFEGIKELYDSVSSTLGPYGCNVIIERKFQDPIITKDGVTVARNIEFKDNYKNLGVQIVKQVACKTDLLVGDGTTTSTVLTYHLYKACLDYLNNKDHKLSKLELISILDDCNKYIINKISSDSVKISTDDSLLNVALISANSDNNIAELIFKAVKSAGNSLNIQVDINNKVVDEIRVSDGMKLFTGFCTPHFINKKSTSECELINPLVFITEDNLLNSNDAAKILNNALPTKKPLLIFCPVCASEALQTFVLNKEKGICECCVVTFPQYGVSRSEIIEELCAITGATPISMASGKPIISSKIDDYGSLQKCLVSINNTILTRNPDFNNSKLISIIEDIQEKLSTCNINEAAKYSMRLDRLCGTIVEIMVGGLTEVEVKERKDRVVDAVSAVRAALEDGIVVGSGKELYNIANDINLTDIAKDFYSNLSEALVSPMNLILSSAGITPDYDAFEINPTYGYNAITKEFGNLFELGIIDPAKVTKTAVNNAFSVVKILLNTNVVLTIDE